jgi:hypothetical protein
LAFQFSRTVNTTLCPSGHLRIRHAIQHDQILGGNARAVSSAAAPVAVMHSRPVSAAMVRKIFMSIVPGEFFSAAIFNWRL